MPRPAILTLALVLALAAPAAASAKQKPVDPKKAAAWLVENGYQPTPLGPVFRVKRASCSAHSALFECDITLANGPKLSDEFFAVVTTKPLVLRHVPAP